MPKAAAIKGVRIKVTDRRCYGCPYADECTYDMNVEDCEYFYFKEYGVDDIFEDETIADKYIDFKRSEYRSEWYEFSQEFDI